MVTEPIPVSGYRLGEPGGLSDGSENLAWFYAVAYVRQ